MPKWGRRRVSRLHRLHGRGVPRARTPRRGAARDVVEEAEDAFGEQRRGLLVVRRQAAVSEQMIVNGVEEQLRVWGRRAQLGRRRGRLPQRSTGRPSCRGPAPEHRWATRRRTPRSAGRRNNRAPCAPSPSLGEHLRGHDTEGEPWRTSSWGSASAAVRPRPRSPVHSRKAGEPPRHRRRPCRRGDRHVRLHVIGSAEAFCEVADPCVTPCP